MDILESKIKIEITGLKRPLRFRLINMYDHLINGGMIRIEFNGDGTHMAVDKVEKTL